MSKTTKSRVAPKKEVKVRVIPSKVTKVTEIKKENLEGEVSQEESRRLSQFASGSSEAPTLQAHEIPLSPPAPISTQAAKARQDEPQRMYGSRAPAQENTRKYVSTIQSSNSQANAQNLQGSRSPFLHQQALRDANALRESSLQGDESNEEKYRPMEEKDQELRTKRRENWGM